MSNNASSLRIWDLPTRLFHWAFAVSVIGAYISVKVGGSLMEWHVRFGLTALGLVIFRVIWGFVGPRHARFRSFVRGPAEIREYLRHQPMGWAGHNPLGALSILAMLADLGLQAVTGLFATDEVMVDGPLYHTVSESTSDLLTEVHQANEFVIVTLVCLHLLAIAWYTFAKRHPLVPAMVTGDMPTAHLPGGAEPSEDSAAVRLRALVLAVVVAGFVWWLAA